MRGWYGGNLRCVGQEDWDPIHDRESSTAICAAKQARRSYQLAPANRAGEERREVRIHAAGPTNICLEERASIHQPSGSLRIGAIIA
jgi:hypothetical protein